MVIVLFTLSGLIHVEEFQHTKHIICNRLVF